MRSKDQPTTSIRAIGAYAKFLFGHTENMAIKRLSARASGLPLRLSKRNAGTASKCRLEVIGCSAVASDDKVIADFRKDNGAAIKKVCVRFVERCRQMGPLTKPSVAIDGSKFKAVNNRDKNFTRNKTDRWRAQLKESVLRYLQQLETADRQEPTQALGVKAAHLKVKLAKLKEEMGKLDAHEKRMLASPDGQISLTDPDSRSMKQLRAPRPAARPWPAWRRSPAASDQNPHLPPRA